MTHFLILGATGYVGAAALERFLDHPHVTTSDWTFTAVVRSAEKAEKLRSIGVISIVGSLDDSHILEEGAAKADVILSFADADHLGSITALLRGSKRRFKQRGTKPLFLHISGTGVLLDSAMGKHASDFVYTDLDVASIAALPPTAIHRNVDLAIVEADEAGYLDSYIILPGLIVGKVSGKFVDLGICKGINLMFPTLLLKIALDRGGVVGTMGGFNNIWPIVGLADLVDLILLIFNAIINDRKSIGHGKEGYFFAVNGEATMYELSIKPLVEELYAAGKIKSKTAVSELSDEEVAQLGILAHVLSGNARARADKARALGWKPKRDLAELLEDYRMHARLAVQNL